MEKKFIVRREEAHLIWVKDRSYSSSAVSEISSKGEQGRHTWPCNNIGLILVVCVEKVSEL